MASRTKTKPPVPIVIEEIEEAPEGVPMPETLRVGPHDYTLGTFDTQVMAQSGNLGHHDYFNLEIKLLDNMRPQLKAEVAVHEAFHALWEASGLRNMERFDEEHAVSVLSKAMLQLWRDNPEWMAWIEDLVGAER